jgi:hypothetical protein
MNDLNSPLGVGVKNPGVMRTGAYVTVMKRKRVPGYSNPPSLLAFAKASAVEKNYGG